LRIPLGAGQALFLTVVVAITTPSTAVVELVLDPGLDPGVTLAWATELVDPELDFVLANIVELLAGMDELSAAGELLSGGGAASYGSTTPPIMLERSPLLPPGVIAAPMW